MWRDKSTTQRYTLQIPFPLLFKLKHLVTQLTQSNLMTIWLNKSCFFWKRAETWFSFEKPCVLFSLRFISEMKKFPAKTRINLHLQTSFSVKSGELHVNENISIRFLSRKFLKTCYVCFVFSSFFVYLLNLLKGLNKMRMMVWKSSPLMTISWSK